MDTASASGQPAGPDGVVLRPDSRPPSSDRLLWADIARGAGIVLVIAGHVLILDDAVYAQSISRGIWLFHMPFFFVLSGYFYTPAPSADLIPKRIHTLLVPYMSFLISLTLLDMVLTTITDGFPSLSQLRLIATNGILGGQFLVGKLGVFWFVTCLFLTQCLYNLVAIRARSPFAPPILLLVGVALLSGYVIPVAFAGMRFPWGLSAVPMALVAFWFGHVLGTRRPTGQLVAVFVLSVLAICGLAASSGTSFSLDMKNANFGPPVLGIALAKALSLVLIRLAVAAQAWRPARWLISLGNASLVIMFMHQFVHLSLRSLGVGNAAVLIAASLLLPLGLAMVLERSRLTRLLFLGRASPPAR